MTLSLPQRAGEMVCVCDRELQPAASRATQGPIPGGQGSGAHLFLWWTSPQSPCLLHDVLCFDGCLVTEEVIQESAVITCKRACVVPVTCGSLHVYLLLWFWQS